MKYIKLEDLKQKLGRSTRSIYQLVEQGVIPTPVKLGGQNLWREDLVDAAIANLAAEQNAGWDKFEGRQA